MINTADITAMLLDLPSETRASLAVELIDSLDDGQWEADALAKLADERDAELESGAVSALSYDEFLAGIQRPQPSS